jgi:glyoxylase I family protein
MPGIAGIHHAALTVSDVERSAAWYQDLLGLQCVMSGDDETVSFRVLADFDSGLVLGVRQYHERAGTGDQFDEFRVGLDHLALQVGTRADLEAWETELSRRSITFTPIAETPIGTLIVFRDPDGIQLEFWLPAGG